LKPRRFRKNGRQTEAYGYTSIPESLPYDAAISGAVFDY
jgi:hypothetical protein